MAVVKAMQEHRSVKSVFLILSGASRYCAVFHDSTDFSRMID